MTVCNVLIEYISHQTLHLSVVFRAVSVSATISFREKTVNTLVTFHVLFNNLASKIIHSLQNSAFIFIYYTYINNMKSRVILKAVLFRYDRPLVKSLHRRSVTGDN